MTDHTDLLRRLRSYYEGPTKKQPPPITDEAADAIEALQIEVERTDARCEEVEDRYEQTAERALILEVENAALRQDAEHWRKLRRLSHHYVLWVINSDWSEWGSKLDAMREGKG